ncbi:MAG: glycosyltransferase family 9 protein [Candidatus Aceula meridiana]|nr:glycosyltransferase family 9 protein [Candidatus Aceula meridiana]
MIKKREFKNILVVRTDRIGDVVLTTPAIEALRKAYPKARITILVNPETKDIVVGNPFLDEVLVYDQHGKDKGFFGFWHFVFVLRRHKFDLAINYHLKNRTNAMLFHAGIKPRIGFKNKKLNFFLTQYPDPRTDGTKHEAQYCLELLKYIGVEFHDLNLCVGIDPESEEWADKLFLQKKIGPNDKVFAIHPGASCISKRWPPERFAEVIEELDKKYPAKIILIGAGDNQLIAREVLASTNVSVIDLTGQTSISQSVSILKRSSLLISNDSGPVHLAVGVHTSVVSILGRNQPGLSQTRWRPLGKKDIVLHNNIGCKVCLAHECKINFKCLRSISVSNVLAATDEILKS